MIRRVLLLVTLGVLFAGAAVFAATSPFTLQYTVAGLPVTPIETLKADPVGPGIEPLELTRGPGIKAAGLTNGFSSNGWDVAQTRDGAFSAGAYYQMGFTVQPGYAASLSTLDLALRRSATNGPMFFEIWASLDGFTTPGFLVTEFTYRGRTSGTAPILDPLLENPFYYMQNDLPGRVDTTTTPGDPIPTVDLSKIAQLQNIPAGSVVTIRLYAWGNEKTTPSNTVALGRMIGPKITGVLTSN